MRRSKLLHYSITSSASASTVAGTVIPSVFAVFLIDYQSELARLLDGEIAGLCAIQNFPGIDARVAKAVHEVG
jgi:hypothetical protein